MNPDELLSQIRALLDQYLAMGSDTPVAAEAQALSAAIDATSGGGGMPPEGGLPPEMAMAGGAPPEALMMGGEVGMPDMTGGMPLDQMESGNYGSFGDARAALEEDTLKKIKGRK